VEPDATSVGGSVTKFRVDEVPENPSKSMAATDVNVTAPGNVEASESLKEGVAYGMTNISGVAKANLSLPGSSSVHVAQAPAIPQPKKDEKDPIPPAFP